MAFFKFPSMPPSNFPFVACTCMPRAPFLRQLHKAVARLSQIWCTWASVLQPRWRTAPQLETDLQPRAASPSAKQTAFSLEGPWAFGSAGVLGSVFPKPQFLNSILVLERFFCVLELVFGPVSFYGQVLEFGF